jgi:hypothetical protein
MTTSSLGGSPPSLFFCVTFHELMPKNCAQMCDALQMRSGEGVFYHWQHLPVNRQLRRELALRLNEVFDEHPDWRAGLITLVVADEGEQAVAALLQELIYRATGRFPQVFDLVAIHDVGGEFDHYDPGTLLKVEEEVPGEVLSAIGLDGLVILEELASDVLRYIARGERISGDHVLDALVAALGTRDQAVLLQAALYLHWQLPHVLPDSAEPPLYGKFLAALKALGVAIERTW